MFQVSINSIQKHLSYCQKKTFNLTVDAARPSVRTPDANLLAELFRRKIRLKIKLIFFNSPVKKIIVLHNSEYEYLYNFIGFVKIITLSRFICKNMVRPWFNADFDLKSILIN